MIEIDGQVVKDAAWFRNKTDFSHINVAEPDETIKGIKVEAKEVRANSTTALNWIRAAVTEHQRVKTKGCC